MPQHQSQEELYFLKGGGEAGAQIRACNWEETSLGQPSTWPECLRTALSICLNSSFPIAIYWGADFNLLYNDAYILIAGDKHPWLMGKPREIAWPEAWELTKPQFERVMVAGESARLQDHQFYIKRFGFTGEAYFDYTLSPIRDAEGNICGIMNAVIETTQRVITDRRNKLLHELSLQSHRFESQQHGYVEALHPLIGLNMDIPFAVLYRFSTIEDSFHLTQAVGIDKAAADKERWPLQKVFDEGLSSLAHQSECNAGVMMIPVRESSAAVSGILVLGVNPYVQLDKDYQQFLDAVAMQIIAAINNGANFDREKQTASLIKESEDQLQFAIDAAELATWDLDPATNLFSGNNRLKSWFGLSAEHEIDLSDALAIIQESDRLRVTMAIQQAMTFSSGGHYDIEYTIINSRDLEPRIVKAKGKALFNANQEVTRFSGTLQDITEQITSRRALEAAFENTRLAQEAAQLGTFDMDLVNGSLEWDDRCRLLFGISHRDSITYEKDFLEGLHEDDRERITTAVKYSLIRKLSNGNFDEEYRTIGVEDHQLRWIKAKGKVFFNDDDEPLRFIGSVLEITDQKQNELRKNDFIGMVSHELKTPLTSLKAYVQILNNRAKQEQNVFSSSTLDKVEQQINKMGTMINGFLNVSRLEAGKIHLDKTEFNIEKLITEIIEEATPIMADHEIRLIPCDAICIRADRDKIGQVLTNLVSNAVKYSPRGKFVEISCNRVGDNAQISVRDEGMGIRPQDKDRLFDRFYRVETAHTQNISGFGIGLYLSAEIVRRHGGKIWVESQKAVGSTFFFSIPLNPGAEEEQK